MEDIRKMQLGQVVDFVIAYNERHEEAEKKSQAPDQPTRRRATQAEIDAFFG